MIETFGNSLWLFAVLCALVCASLVELRVHPRDHREAAQWGYSNEQGDDHLLEQPRDAVAILEDDQV